VAGEVLAAEEDRTPEDRTSELAPDRAPDVSADPGDRPVATDAEEPDQGAGLHPDGSSLPPSDSSAGPDDGSVDDWLATTPLMRYDSVTGSWVSEPGPVIDPVDPRDVLPTDWCGTTSSDGPDEEVGVPRVTDSSPALSQDGTAAEDSSDDGSGPVVQGSPISPRYTWEQIQYMRENGIPFERLPGGGVPPRNDGKGDDRPRVLGASDPAEELPPVPADAESDETTVG